MPNDNSRPTASFVARYPTADQAQLFLENVDRVIGTTGTSTRDDCEVSFTAYTVDTAGYPVHGDIRLSVGYYGGPGTELSIDGGDFRTVPREM